MNVWFLAISIAIMDTNTIKRLFMNENLMNAAMEMSPNERVVFAELMLESIEHENDSIKNAWISEVKNRMQMVKEGKSKLLDFDTVC